MPVCARSCAAFTLPACATAKRKRVASVTSRARTSPVSSRWRTPCWPKASSESKVTPRSRADGARRFLLGSVSARDGLSGVVFLETDPGFSVRLGLDNLGDDQIPCTLLDLGEGVIEDFDFKKHEIVVLHEGQCAEQSVAQTRPVKNFGNAVFAVVKKVIVNHRSFATLKETDVFDVGVIVFFGHGVPLRSGRAFGANHETNDAITRSKRVRAEPPLKGNKRDGAAFHSRSRPYH